MKVIIAGSRTRTDPRLLELAITEFRYDITEVVSGCANGADLLGEQWAKENNIPIKRFHADWNKHGKAAGPIRNSEMAEYAEGLIALWDGKSKGTADMIRKATKKGLVVKVQTIP